MPTCTLENGDTIAYAVSGEGAPCVFIHGVGAYKESWDGVIAALPEGLRCYRYDLRGHGDSEKVPGAYTLDDFCSDLAGFMDALGIERASIVGFSLGGLIAQAFALSHSDRLDKLALISTVAARNEAEKERVAQRAANLKANGAQSHLTGSMERWFTPGFLERHPEVIEQRRHYALKVDPDCFVSAYMVLAESDLAEELHKIGAPTLVMTGENDIGSTPRMAAVIEDRIPDCRLRILAGLKHSVLLEAPELVAGELAAFFVEEGTPAGAKGGAA